MKKTTGITISALLFSGAALSAQAVFPDLYWGGDPTSNKSVYQADVIGEGDVFDLTGFNLRYNDLTDVLDVQIHGNYFDDLLADADELLDTYMGDLFISTDGLSWIDGEEATLDDFYGQPDATTWEYAATLGTYDNAQGHLDGVDSDNPMSGSLLSVTDPDTNIELSKAGRGVFRGNQEVRYIGGGASQVPVSWFFSDDHSFLQISIADAGSVFGDADEIGFHWTMSCGNDVLEFSMPGNITPVPEPSLIGILGIGGLFGFLWMRRRRQNRKS
ncbi:MAG: PEP-CTERM sorting domain-containing protein [Verrucomicrobia bacterium]|nr:PEP-CTERM sorting domain-containing protein [Verrucomicrobiota bacterium]